MKTRRGLRVLLVLAAFSALAPARAEERATVQDIRFWSSTGYARVVINLSGEARYETNELPANPAAGKGPRVYVDVRGAQIAPRLRATMPVPDGPVATIRASQFAEDTVRVVLDLGSRARVDAFSLPTPYRIVLDVRDGAASAEPPARAAEDPPSEGVSFAQRSGLQIRRVIIDPGHGGKDPGAIGHKGLKEKAVALALGRALKKSVEKKLGIEAVLTRQDDTFLSLDERTAKAEALRGDLFVSLHLNSNPNRRASGIETYSLNFTYDTYDEEARRVAARENQVSEEKLGDVEFILQDLMRTEWINESAILARLIQKSMIRSVRAAAADTHDLGSKRAPFYVLKASMPSVLVEASFITNPTEAKRVQTARYQEKVADGIAEGIRQYMDTLRQIGVE